jgi:hypothetical protein
VPILRMAQTESVARIGSRMSTERKLMAALWFGLGIAMIIVRHNTTGYIFGACWLVGGVGWMVRNRLPKNDT